MNIYVGNLSYEVTEADLKQEFEAFGEVTSISIIKDNYSGQSKGFGFVTIPDEESANRAISELNGKEFKGRELKLSEAKPFNPDEPRPRRSFNGGGNRRPGFGGPRRSFGGERRERF